MPTASEPQRWIDLLAALLSRHFPATRGTTGDAELLLDAQAEHTYRQHYATRDEAGADVFDYIGRFHNWIRRRSTLGNRSPVAFEQQAAVAWFTVHRLQCNSKCSSR